MNQVSVEAFTATVADFVAERSGLAAAEIGPAYDYIAGGLLDSVSIINLVFFIEDTFGVRFQPEDFALDRINTAAHLYERYLEASVGTDTSLTGRGLR